MWLNNQVVRLPTVWLGRYIKKEVSQRETSFFRCCGKQITYASQVL